MFQLLLMNQIEKKYLQYMVKNYIWRHEQGGLSLETWGRTASSCVCALLHAGDLFQSEYFP